MPNENNIVRAVFGAQEIPAPDGEPEHRRRGGGGTDLDAELSGYMRNDYGNAQRLIKRYGDGLLYVRDMGWHSFMRTHWSLADGEDQAKMRAHEVAFGILDEAEVLTKEGPFIDEEPEDFEKRIESHRKFGIVSGNQSRIVAMIQQAAPYITVTADDMDADRFLFNVENGTLVLGHRESLETKGLKEPTVEHRPHDRADHITRCAPIVFDPNASCPTFHKFLERVLPDNAVRLFLQRYFGYSLTGSVAEQCLLLLQGKGRNGKSTLLELMGWMMGDYSLTLPVSSLLYDDRRRGSEATPDLARLPGARLAIASEPNAGARLDEGLIKQLTAGERMTVRHLNQGFFEFDPQFKLCLSFNNAPQVRGQDDGIWRRLRLVMFDVQIPLEEVDSGLLEKLKGEAPGILNWLLDGYRMWCEGGLQPPEAVLAATDAYREDSDRVGQFLRSATERDAAATISAKALYTAYQVWCRANALDPVSGNYFGRQIIAHGFVRDKAGVVFYRGLRITDESLTKPSGEPPAPKSEGDYGED